MSSPRVTTKPLRPPEPAATGPALLVGLTGGIGSGKSSVAARLVARGVVVIDADAIAREIVLPGSPVLDDLAARFGRDILDADGGLRRQVLAERAFADDASRRALDELTHPAIRERLAARVRAHAADDLVVVDHPLLIETGQVDDFDELVVVLAGEDTRVARLVGARGLDADDVRARMRAQTDDATRRQVATYLVHNDAGPDELDVAVDELYEWLAARVRSRS